MTQEKIDINEYREYENRFKALPSFVGVCTDNKGEFVPAIRTFEAKKNSHFSPDLQRFGIFIINGTIIENDTDIIVSAIDQLNVDETIKTFLKYQLDQKITHENIGRTERKIFESSQENLFIKASPKAIEIKEEENGELYIIVTNELTNIQTLNYKMLYPENDTSNPALATFQTEYKISALNDRNKIQLDTLTSKIYYSDQEIYDLVVNGKLSERMQPFINEAIEETLNLDKYGRPIKSTTIEEKEIDEEERKKITPPKKFNRKNFAAIFVGVAVMGVLGLIACSILYFIPAFAAFSAYIIASTALSGVLFLAGAILAAKMGFDNNKDFAPIATNPSIKFSDMHKEFGPEPTPDVAQGQNPKAEQDPPSF